MRPDRTRQVDGALPAPVSAEVGGSTLTEPGDDGVFAEGERIVAEVAFDGPVTVDTAEGSPALGLALGGVRREAAYESGSGTAVLSFAYTAVEDDDGAGQARAIANGLVLNGATIRGEDGTDAVLEFGAAPGVASVRIVPPGSDDSSGAGTGGTAGDGAWDPGEALEVAFVFEEPVEVETSGGTPSVAVLLGGAAEKQAAYVRGSGTDRLVFAYTLVEADGRATSALVPGDTLALYGGAIRSTAGLDATPGGNAAVTLALAALPACGEAGSVCTADGRALAGPLALTVPGPAALSVADASVEEGPGAVLEFAVTLDRARHAAVTVDYATSDGPSPKGAVAGSDYTATSGTLTFAAGETGKTVPVAVLDDSHDEGSETMTFTLSNASGARIADGEATGTIDNSDAIPKAWIARFGRTVAEQVLDAVEGRMRGSRTPGAEVSLAGERIGGAASRDVEALERREAEREARRLSDWLKGETDPEAGRPESRSVAPRDLLTGSSFALTMETARKREFVSLWGRGAVSRFDGRDGDLSLDGEVVSGMLGADWTRDRWSAGLIVSHSRGEGGYSGLGSGAGTGAGGKVTATLTGVFPWARHALSDRVEAWGVAGYGAGELTVTPRKPETGDGGNGNGDGDGAAMRADLDLKMAAAGLRGVILDPGSGSGAGAGIGLTAKTDALVVQTASGRGRGADGGNLEPARATVTRLRLGLEASRPVRLGGEATVDDGSVLAGARK